MKEDANLIRGHLADIVCWTRTRQLTASWKASVGIFLLIGKLDFSRINPYVVLLT